jgi:hypothetical protein
VRVPPGGLKLVGPLPKELQVPLPYSAVLSARPLDEVASQAFLQALASGQASLRHGWV